MRTTHDEAWKLRSTAIRKHLRMIAVDTVISQISSFKCMFIVQPEMTEVMNLNFLELSKNNMQAAKSNQF